MLNIDILPLSEEYSMKTVYFELEGVDLNTEEQVFLRFQTNSLESVAFEIDVQFVSSKINSGVVYGMIILICM